MGRPSSYTQEVADKICSELMQQRSLRQICKDEGMPSEVTVFNWLQSNDQFFKNYARARDVQAEQMADELIDIADELPTITVCTPKGNTYETTDSAGVNRNRVRVDTRKWVISKILPKKYGDKLELNAKVETSGMSDEELSARIALLLPEVLPSGKQS